MEAVESQSAVVSSTEQSLKQLLAEFEFAAVKLKVGSSGMEAVTHTFKALIDGHFEQSKSSEVRLFPPQLPHFVVEDWVCSRVHECMFPSRVCNSRLFLVYDLWVFLRPRNWRVLKGSCKRRLRPPWPASVRLWRAMSASFNSFSCAIVLVESFPGTASDSLWCQFHCLVLSCQRIHRCKPFESERVRCCGTFALEWSPARRRLLTSKITSKLSRQP
mgnify:CR=1 FL=1